MKNVLLAAALLIPIFTYAQVDDLDNRMNGITTMIECRTNNHISKGSGFFYFTLSPDSNKKGGRGILGMFLITNRHVIFNRNLKGIETSPNNLTFYLRKKNDSNFDWQPISISKDNLEKRIVVSRDSSIDLAAVYIYDLIPQKMSVDSNSVRFYNGVAEDDLPNKKNSPIQVTDDVVILGYPNGYYDHQNLFPIVKTGIIASRWGANFNGKPYFLVDSKLMSGFSGSLVLSKPSNIMVINGEMEYSNNKQFEFLGVYSGEPYSIKTKILDDEDGLTTYGVGIVWYGYLIKDILNNGILWYQSKQIFNKLK